jgi:decaprenyl-phosphate phosphoribosyltransferase
MASEAERIPPPGEHEPAATPGLRGSWTDVPRALLVSARPRQWAKNVLVFGAPATGGVLSHPSAFAAAFGAFAAFCLVASGVYFINDLADSAGDLRHPVKRLRPIASRRISRPLAAGTAAALIAAGLGIAGLTAGWSLFFVLGGYVLLSFAYTFGLRSIALLDLGAIAGGFLLRAVAGGVACDVPLSMWFLMVAGFGSLFLAAGKRRAEYVELGEERRHHRRSLDEYSEPYLRYVQYTASTVTIAAYTQWSFEGAAGGTVWSGLSIIPFVLGILRYALHLERGRGATPEDVVLTDVPLIALGLAWVVLVAIGVYAS